MPDMTYKLEALKEMIKDGERELLFINISYPVFENEKQSEKEKRLNEFYQKGAGEFEKFCKTKLSAKLKTECRGKCAAVMQTQVPFIDGKSASVITDVYFFDGKSRKERRFADNWLLSEKYPRVLKANAAFPVSRRAKKLYTDEICSKIMTAEGGFSYFSDAVLSAKKHFDENRFYLTPKGVAFYYEKGLLCPEKEGSPAFVIPYKAIEKLI